MCLISYLTFSGIFGRHPVSGDKVTAPVEKLMGPNFIDLVESTKASQKALEAYPREKMTVVTADGLKLVGYFLLIVSRQTKQLYWFTDIIRLAL